MNFLLLPRSRRVAVLIAGAVVLTALLLGGAQVALLLRVQLPPGTEENVAEGTTSTDDLAPGAHTLTIVARMTDGRETRETTTFTVQPTAEPTPLPTPPPTTTPVPTEEPTPTPTAAPTASPEPTAEPTPSPTATPVPTVPPPTASPTPAPSRRPNIVLVVTDDQRWDTVSAMPIVTRELAGQGLTFENAFATTPLCCPSRASIFTGQLAYTHGVRNNAPPVGGASVFRERGGEQQTIAVDLRRAGYRTGLFGKYLNRYGENPADPDGPTETYVPPGWSTWRAITDKRGGIAFNGGPMNIDGRMVQLPPEVYVTDWLAEELTQFVRSTPSDQPFFAVFTPSAPHGPSDPAPRHVGMFSNFTPSPPPLPEAGNLLPWMEQALASQTQTPEWAAERTPVIRKQLESLQAVDEAVGTFLQTLTETGRLADTYVIFTSDNGFQWLEAGAPSFGKSVPYEASIRVPFIVRGPGVRRGEREAGFALNIDIAPTIAEIANVRPSATVDGASFLPLLRGVPTAWRTAVPIEYYQPRALVAPTALHTYHGVRTRVWKYIEYVGGERELYQLSTDPYELHNLADLPGAAGAQARLAQRLRELFPDLGPVP